MSAVGGRPWVAAQVCRVLRNELAIGLCVTNRSRQSIGTEKGPKPPEDWLRVRVFPPMVKPALFRAAQEKLGQGEREPLSPAPMLEALRSLLEQHGRLNARLLNRAPETYGAQTYRRVFGSLHRAYALVGYVPWKAKGVSVRVQREHIIEALREAYQRHGHLTVQIVNADPNLATVPTYRKHFGSMTHAYALAGLPYDRKTLQQAAHRRSAARGTASAVKGSPFGKRSSFSDEDLLQAVRDTYARHQTLSHEILHAEVGGPRPSLYAARFGSLTRAYMLAGLPDAFLGRYRLRPFLERVAKLESLAGPTGA